MEAMDISQIALVPSASDLEQMVMRLAVNVLIAGLLFIATIVLVLGVLGNILAIRRPASKSLCKNCLPNLASFSRLRNELVDIGLTSTFRHAAL